MKKICLAPAEPLLSAVTGRYFFAKPLETVVVTKVVVIIDIIGEALLEVCIAFVEKAHGEHTVNQLRLLCNLFV